MVLDGFNRRVAETVTTRSGGTSLVTEWVALGLRGMGVAAVGLTSSHMLILSTAQAVE